MQAKPPERFLRQPAGAGEVDLHVQLLRCLHGLTQHVGKLLRRQAGGLTGLRLGAAGGNEPGAGDVSHSQLMHEAEGGGIIPVQAAQRRVHRRHQARRHSVADTLHRVIEARCAHQRIVDGGVGAVQRHLHAVKACLIQPAAQLRRQQTAVGVETGHEPLGGLHQFHQICPKGGLSAGEGHLRDIGAAQALQRLLPLSGGQLPALAHGLSGGVAVETLLVAVPCAVPRHGADHQVHAVGCRHIGGIVPQT